MFENHIFSDTLKYESHRLIVATVEGDEPLLLGGIFGAAFLAALLVDTDEGDSRGIALDSEAEQEEFFVRYEREMRRDDWGHLSAEVAQLHDAYIQLSLTSMTAADLCANSRLRDLAMTLVVTYMRRLVNDAFRAHIWEAVPWCAPFARWLWDAARVETRRQRFLKTDWTDVLSLETLTDAPGDAEAPSLFFEGEQAADIMERYLEWLSAEYVAVKQELPGAKITAADRNYIFRQETDWAFLQPEIERYDEEGQRAWERWHTEWTRFLTARLNPYKEVRFWEDDVPESVQEHLLYHLRQQEQHTAHFRQLTTAVYAMRQLGYIRRRCSDADIRQWLSEHLSLDYTERKNASQFQRAMKEHGRYTQEVRDEVIYLESIGFHRFVPASPSQE